MLKSFRRSLTIVLLLGLVTTATLVIQSCSSAATQNLVGSAGSGSEIVRVSVVPRSARLLVGDSLAVVAYGHLRNGDSAVVAATWSATGGSVSRAGWFRADQGGVGTVRAVSVAQPALSDSGAVEVATIELTPDDTLVSTGGSVQVSPRAILPDGSVMTMPAVTWSATGGTISQTGIFSAPDDPGTYDVSAQVTGHAASASLRLKVTPAKLRVLVLNPSSVSLVVGATRQFSLAALWSNGSTVLPAVTWSATGGTVSSAGLYTAGQTAESSRVIATATVDGRADTSDVTISVPAPTLTQLALSPESVTLAPSGTNQYAVSGTWSDGSSTAPAVTYSATGGTITATGLFTAGMASGSFHVVATQQGGTKADTSTVTISAPVVTLLALVLNPKSLTLAPGGAQQFSVAAGWSDGSSAVPPVTYVATGGTIIPTGLYTAGTAPGRYGVIATQQGGTKADTSTLTVVVPPSTLTKLTVAPKSLTLTSGGAQQFGVTGTWSDGSSTVPAATYAATGGTITATGFYTAGTTPGAFRVIATQQGGTKADTATVTIPVAPPTLTILVLNPKSLTLAFGATQQFSVAGSWSDGSSTAPAVSYSAGSGTITTGGLYTAGTTAGTFRVVATQQGGTKADTSTVTVAPPPPTLTKLTISPKTTTLAPNGVRQFTVSGTWSDGSTTVPVATYAATGGTVTTGGLYTAGMTPGTFRVIVTQQGETKADTAVVTVTPPPPTVLVLVTQPGGAVSGAPFTQQPVVELRNAQNQPVALSGAVVTVSKASGTGTLGGTVISTTNPQGRAIFGGLQITGTGDHTLAFTSPGLSTATSQTVAVVLPSLRLLASARNFQMGADVVTTALAASGAYAASLAAQYNSVVADNAMKFGLIHPQPTQYAFTNADQLVSFAQANGMAVHGHTLVWYKTLPPWVTDGIWTKAMLLAVLKDHITTVVGHYRGKVVSWDVVNEAISWDGKTGFQPSVWLTNIGPEYIDSAFVWARAADPAAKLYYNDFGAEGINQKSDSVLALVQRLKARGIPINGVGFQAHFPRADGTIPTPASVRDNFTRFANAGFDIRMSEMDVRIADTAGPSALVVQAVTFRDMLDACLLQPRCTGLTTWGFTDLYSYIPTSNPGFGRALPLDSAYLAKPAFDSLAARLRRP